MNAIEELRSMRDDALALCSVMLNERKQLYSNLTAVQAHNTELLERARRAEAERDALLARVEVLRAHDTIPAPPMVDDFDPRGQSLLEAMASRGLVDAADDDEPSVSDCEVPR